MRYSKSVVSSGKMEIIQIKSDHYNNDLQDLMKNLLVQGEFSDLHLIPKGGANYEPLKVHKFIICANSSFIKAKVERVEKLGTDLNEGMIELGVSRKNSTVIIRLPEIERRILKLILEFVYYGNVAIGEEDLMYPVCN